MSLTTTCISTNLELLELRLIQARNLVGIARQALGSQQRNLAIGTLLPLEQTLPEAGALLSTILLLHRNEPIALRQEVQS